MLSSFWSCASVRSGGEVRGDTDGSGTSCVRAWGSPPHPPIPQSTAWPRHPQPITLQLSGWAEQAAWVRVPRVRAASPPLLPPGQTRRGRAEVASASSCRDRAAVTLQMLRKVIGGRGEGDGEKEKKDGVRQEGAAQPRQGQGRRRPLTPAPPACLAGAAGAAAASCSPTCSAAPEPRRLRAPRPRCGADAHTPPWHPQTATQPGPGRRRGEVALAVPGDCALSLGLHSGGCSRGSQIPTPP